MNYGIIKNYDIANGTGVRVSLFVSGCRHHCKGCFNSETWDFNYGNPYTKEVEAEILEALKPAYIQGFSLLGGEPFEPENQKELAGLLQKIKESYPEKNVWCYTGYLYDVDLIPGTPITLTPISESRQYVTYAFKIPSVMMTDSASGSP